MFICPQIFVDKILTCTEQVAPEEMKMQMRAYLGAAIYNDANVSHIVPQYF